MSFQAKIITGKKNPKARVAVLGAVLLVVSVFLSLMDGYERYALWGFGVSAILLVAGAVWAKGDLSSIKVSPLDVVVTVSEIRIGPEVYPMGQVSEMDFLVEGYDGMQGPDWRSPTEGILNGTMNYLYFTFSGEKISCRFYLPDAVSVQQLGGLFREFYDKGIEFTERNWYGRTLLFQQATEGQVENYRPQ